MRAFLATLGAIAISVGLATPPASAGKGTDYESFKKSIEKFARPMGNLFHPKPRGLCVCQDQTAAHGRAGVLIQQDVDNGGEFFVQVSCWVRVFQPDGANTGGDACLTFELLSK